MSTVDEAAALLDDATRSATPVPQLSTHGTQLTVDEAYAVQAATVARRVARGERIIGMKLGFTSRAKMQQMGISELVWGRLTDAMRVEDGGEVDLARFVHPRVEPEVAFLLGSDVPPGASLPETIAAVEAVASALEIIDSRYSDFRFSLTDVIADNASSSAFVVGPWHRPDVDLANRGIVLSVSGRTVGVGTTAAILGHPARSLAAGLRLAAAAGETLPAGSIVMAGGATSAHPLARACVVRVEISRLGSASFTVAP